MGRDSTSKVARIEELERRLASLEEQNRELRSVINWHSMPNRRQVLGGLLTGGALFGGGIVYGSRSSAQSTIPEESPWSDTDGDGLLEAPDHDGIDVTTVNAQTADTKTVDTETVDAGTLNAETVDAERLGSLETDGIAEEFTYVQNGRPLYSTESQRYFVDPDAGDDSNPGTESEPLQTIEAAVSNLALFQFHEFELHLDRPNPSNRYDSPNLPPCVLGYDEQESSKGASGTGRTFYLRGDPENPGDYPFERGRKLGIGFASNADIPNGYIEGVELGGVSLEGDVTFSKCRFTGWTGDGTCITGYTGQADFHGCTFTAEATYAFFPAWKVLHSRAGTFECEYVCNESVNLGGFLFLDGDPGIPFFESASARDRSNIYIQTTGSPVLNGPGELT